MPEKSPAAYTVLHLRFKLRVSPDVLLSQCREAACVIARVEGLIWKIWVSQEEALEMGGLYLFANRENAEAYLNHPIVQAVRLNPNVVSTHSQLWNVESALSIITRAPLSGIREQYPESEPVLAGGR